MGLGTDMIQYFHLLNSANDGDIRPRTLFNFLFDFPNYSKNIQELSIACNRLVSEGLLQYLGHSPEGGPLLGASYGSLAKISDDLLSYGVFDFLVFGFPLIRNHFERSVLPLIVITESGDHSIGSGFLIQNNQLVTAAHCVTKMRTINIAGWNSNTNLLRSIHISTDGKVDLAVLTFEDDPFPDAPKFRLQAGNVLEEVLSMGYPPIPGFQNILVSETAHVAGLLKSTVGQVLNVVESYLDRQNYLLISARVKGGNSGGPIVNIRGAVIGVVTALPSGAETTADTLGYGAAIPQESVSEFLEQINNGSEGVQELPFNVLEDGITTL